MNNPCHVPREMIFHQVWNCSHCRLHFQVLAFLHSIVSQQYLHSVPPDLKLPKSVDLSDSSKVDVNVGKCANPVFI